MERLKTPCQTEREATYKKCAEEFINMVQNGSSKTMTTAYLRKKYGYHSDTSIVRIRKWYVKLQAKQMQNRIESEKLSENIEEIVKSEN